MRLIDADDFKEKINGVCDAGGWLEPVTTAIKEYICKQVDYQTTVDAVDVVRCEDCEHKYRKEYADGMVELLCQKTYDFNGFAADVEPNHFCSYGERRDSDG